MSKLQLTYRPGTDATTKKVISRFWKSNTMNMDLFARFRLFYRYYLDYLRFLRTTRLYVENMLIVNGRKTWPLVLVSLTPLPTSSSTKLKSTKMFLLAGLSKVHVCPITRLKRKDHWNTYNTQRLWNGFVLLISEGKRSQ